MNSSFVYILCSEKYGTLYIGVTSNLARRMYEHKHGLIAGFTEKYHVHKLVYLEKHSFILNAIQREKHLKKWKREWKINLISKHNPEWTDLSKDFLCLT
jgi:putative endonuclease